MEISDYLEQGRMLSALVVSSDDFMQVLNMNGLLSSSQNDGSILVRYNNINTGQSIPLVAMYPSEKRYSILSFDDNIHMRESLAYLNGILISNNYLISED